MLRPYRGIRWIISFLIVREFQIGHQLLKWKLTVTSLFPSFLFLICSLLSFSLNSFLFYSSFLSFPSLRPLLPPSFTSSSFPSLLFFLQTFSLTRHSFPFRSSILPPSSAPFIRSLSLPSFLLSLFPHLLLFFFSIFHSFSHSRFLPFFSFLSFLC